ncbi:uncharacterized protein CDV56_100733 [Aspergillus thermomutatus]|uniref:Uncharacterized protein n=1 Tax=Aspergillus thermomutatus TaxID=41047 RepID=A0A397G368_ASPTH|nr:uncharacterized protein CDV56_100733 [Aspergillus thermomutatus]RHZ43313.1 hypothetical protein CDV56_100733 [Aspergillus thermomutatus]
MADHEEYATQEPTATPAPAKVPPAQISEEPYVVFPIAERAELVKEILERLLHFAIVRINATPASGKSTLMNLMVKHLLKGKEGHNPIYVMIGWNHQRVENAGGWAKYLEAQTGVNGFKWPDHSGYLFLDEAQESYQDDELWAGLFKTVSPNSKCRILLFTSYGSPNRVCEGFDDAKFRKTPMIFDPAQQISLKPDSRVAPDFNPVGLLLDERESMKLVGDCMKSRLSSIFTGAITEDFKRGVWQVTQGHAGLITSFCDVLGRSKDLREYRHSDLHWNMITDIIFKDPVGLFERISGSQFSRGLPRSKDLQNPAVARVLKQAILSPRGLLHSSFVDGSLESRALSYIWRNGWLHAQTQPIGDDTQYVFATDFHRWFCACVFAPADDGIQPLPYLSPLDLAKEVVRRFNPRQLSEPERAMNRNISPLEDQYGKEFYRCIGDVLKRRVVVSPEFSVSYGTQSGILDFFIPGTAWGIELLRENDRISEHLTRFAPGGQYFLLVKERKMKWIVLNCTTKRPSKKRTEYLDQLYHVVFTSDFRCVEILRADLELESAFTLLESHSHSFLS